MARTITVGEYIKGAGKGEKVYIQTFNGMEEVSYIQFPDAPEVVCEKSNGGFGISYCVGYSTELIVACDCLGAHFC
tara:strand:+ start:135 stop:362 length:228 start_codon:yes stop_codon:yes gene_type:complete